MMLALPKLVGYAAVFNRPSQELVEKGRRFREIIRPGAFRRSLDEVRAGKLDVVARYAHKATLGRTSNGTLTLREDAIGLYFEIAPADTSEGRNVVELVRRRDIQRSSFEFVAKRDNWIRQGDSYLRELHDVTLTDVSPVVWSAYPDTSVSLRFEPPAANMRMRLAIAEATL